MCNLSNGDYPPTLHIDYTNPHLAFVTLSDYNSKDLRPKRFRPTELARYSYEEAREFVKKHAIVGAESAAFDRFEHNLRDLEFVSAKDNKNLCLMERN